MAVIVIESETFGLTLPTQLTRAPAKKCIQVLMQVAGESGYWCVTRLLIRFGGMGLMGGPLHLILTRMVLHGKGLLLVQRRSGLRFVRRWLPNMKTLNTLAFLILVAGAIIFLGVAGECACNPSPFYGGDVGCRCDPTQTTGGDMRCDGGQNICCEHDFGQPPDMGHCSTCQSHCRFMVTGCWTTCPSLRLPYYNYSACIANTVLYGSCVDGQGPRSQGWCGVCQYNPPEPSHYCIGCRGAEYPSLSAIYEGERCGIFQSSFPDRDVCCASGSSNPCSAQGTGGRIEGAYGWGVGPPLPPTAQPPYDGCVATFLRGTGCRVYQGLFGALVRASRRGQDPSTFGPNQAPGAAANWGPAYDTNYNPANFGSWTNISTLDLVNSSTSALHSSGTPMPQAWVQVGDPTSYLAGTTEEFQTTNFRYTALARTTRIFGPDASDGFSQWWPVTIVAGTLQPFQALPFTVIPLARTNPSWTRFPTSTPPQPCDPSPCDTWHDVVQTEYGPSPDSKTPYVGLILGGQWGRITGQVRDLDDTRLSAIPVGVTVSPPNSLFPPIEKITDADGNFTILVGTGQIRLDFNNPLPAIPSYPHAAHYYNPHYVSVSTQITIGAWIPSGGILTIDPSIIYLSTTAPSVGTIRGVVRAAETSSAINGIIVILRDGTGHVVASTPTAPTSDPGVNYSFERLIPRTYFVDVALGRNQVADPAHARIPLAVGQQSVNNFTVRGVTAGVRVTSDRAGTFVLLTRAGPPDPLNPPSIDQTGESIAGAYSATTALDRQVSFSVAPGFAYRLTCWFPDGQGQYIRSEGTQDFARGDTLTPQMNYEGSCPPPQP